MKTLIHEYSFLCGWIGQTVFIIQPDIIRTRDDKRHEGGYKHQEVQRYPWNNIPVPAINKCCCYGAKNDKINNDPGKKYTLTRIGHSQKHTREYSQYHGRQKGEEKCLPGHMPVDQQQKGE